MKLYFKRNFDHHYWWYWDIFNFGTSSRHRHWLDMWHDDPSICRDALRVAAWLRGFLR